MFRYYLWVVHPLYNISSHKSYTTAYAGWKAIKQTQLTLYDFIPTLVKMQNKENEAIGEWNVMLSYKCYVI